MRKIARLWVRLAVCAVCAAMTGGCWDSKDIDNRLLVGAMGLEKASERTLKVWLRFPLALSTEETAKEEFFTISQEGKTVPDALNKSRYKLPKSLDPSTTRALLVDDDLARSGLDPYLEFAIRERSVPLDTVVAIVKGNMERVFTSNNPTGELSGIYTKLFFESYAGGTPRKNKTMLWEVYSKLYNPFQTNLIPLLAEGKQNSFMLAGNAIFIGDRMVGELSQDESLLYEIFTHRFHDSEIELMDRSDVRIVHNHIRVRTALQGGVPIIGIDCALVTTLIDSSHYSKQTAMEIVEELKDDLEENAASMFKKTQQQGADIFGFGNRFRSRLAPSQYAEWPQMFKRAQIEYKFHITLRNTGLEFMK